MSLQPPRRQLAWLGHVARMDCETRIPRKLLSSWVNADRAACGVEMTYGRALQKAFRRAKVNDYGKKWQELAQDREKWLEMIKKIE